MLKVQSFDGYTLVNSKASLQHPMADEVSIAIGDGAMSTFPYTVELAFFKNDEWVCEILSEFAEYADGEAGGTRVYAHVPLNTFATFLDSYTPR